VKKTGTENTKAWYSFSSVEAGEQYGGGFDELQDIVNTKTKQITEIYEIKRKLRQWSSALVNLNKSLKCESI
jgi:hypothetical protein